MHSENDQLKIAFDGDAVIFSDDSEKVFHEEGLDAFIENEVMATSPLKEGAATIIPRDGKNNTQSNNDQLKIAFDGDAVIFSDDSEKVFHEEGLEAFIENEVTATTALKEGPFKSFLVELNDIQNDFDINDCPIRTALVIARSAPSDKRVIKTLREWGVRIDESLFLGGMSKRDFLKSFQADIFFDDQKKHIIDTQNTTASGHVPYGIKNT